MKFKTKIIKEDLKTCSLIILMAIGLLTVAYTIGFGDSRLLGSTESYFNAGSSFIGRIFIGLLSMIVLILPYKLWKRWTT